MNTNEQSAVKTLDEIRLQRAREKRARRVLRDHPEYKVRRDDTCPQCGYGVVIEGPVIDVGPLDACASCGALWEREEREHPTLECCDDCAFSPGSEEQRNPDEWRKIVDGTVREHGMFLCHKRTPIDLHDDGTYAYRHRDETGRVRYGTQCHGWIKAKCTVLVKEAETRDRQRRGADGEGSG